MSFLIFPLVALLLLVLFSGAYVFFAACLRGKELPWLDEQALKKTSYARFYEHICAADTWLQQHKAQDIWVKSSDGLNLHALWIPAQQQKGTIILAHGYRSTYLADFGLVLDLYHNLGLNLLIPDQRCHGKSDGKYITFGVKESDDILKWIDYHNRILGALPVVLSGLSMGASTVMYLADQKLPENVCGIIADCGFTSPKEIISLVFKRTVHLWPGPSMVVADLFARLFAGFSLLERDTRKALAGCRLPILMVHGKEDDFVPSWMSEAAFARCTAPKQLLLAEDAGHGVSFLHIPEQYTQAVITFLNTYMDGFTK